MRRPGAITKDRQDPSEARIFKVLEISQCWDYLGRGGVTYKKGAEINPTCLREEEREEGSRYTLLGDEPSASKGDMEIADATPRRGVSEYIDCSRVTLDRLFVRHFLTFISGGLS